MFRRWKKDLVDGAGDLVAAQRRNNPLDLPPVAEPRDIAVVATALGTCGRFEARVVAETLDELGRIGQSGSIVDEKSLHEPGIAGCRFPTADDCRQRRISHLWRGLPADRLPWEPRCRTRPAPEDVSSPSASSPAFHSAWRS